MNRRTRALHLARGFTLTELMITVAVAAILVSIAVASYSTQMQKAHRTDARQAVLDLAGREEAYYSVNNAYASNWLALGYLNAATASTTAIPITNMGSSYYNVQVCVPAGSGPCTIAGPAAPSYQVQAVPIAGSVQAKDTSCQLFIVDSTGNQASYDGAGNNTTTICWAQ